jgi:serine protease Do
MKRSKNRRRGLYVLLAMLAVAGCVPPEKAGQAPPGGAESPEQKSQSPENQVLPLPAQLEPGHPPPAAVRMPSSAPSQLGKPGTEESKQQGMNLANSLSEVFHTAANRVVPAVVTIRNVSRESGEFGEGAMSSIPGQFFGDDDSDEVRESLGSGFIIDASGVILTNYHVVRAAIEKQGQSWVELHDGRQFEISVVKGDSHTDLAVVKLKGASDLPVAELGDSDALKVGDWVLAVGNPFGLEATVTAGIISAKGRGLSGSPREEFLQTDTPINPGNSGGPLVNLRGAVVGINTAIHSTTGGYQGIGFAIPSSMAKWVVRQLIEKGSVRWAYLGVGVRKLTPELAKRLNRHDVSGVLVLEVRRSSPASRAGIRRGDLITEFDEKPVSDPRELQSAAGMSSIGSRHSLTVIRDGKPQSVQVTIAEQPPENDADRPTSATGAPGHDGVENVNR